MFPETETRSVLLLTVEPTGDVTIDGCNPILPLNGIKARKRRDGRVRLSLKRGYDGHAIQLAVEDGIVTADAVFAKGHPSAGGLVPSASGHIRLLDDHGRVRSLSPAQLARLAADSAQAARLDC